MANEIPRPMNCRFRAIQNTKGIRTINGPYIGRKKRRAARGSLKKLWREGWSIGIWMVCVRPQSQKGQMTSRMTSVDKMPTTKNASLMEIPNLKGSESLDGESSHFRVLVVDDVAMAPRKVTPIMPSRASATAASMNEEPF